MAPRKVKPQCKRNNIKIKSALNSRKRDLKSVKKPELGEKPLTGLKWMNKEKVDGKVRKCHDDSVWVKTDDKHKGGLRSSDTIVSEYEEYPQQDSEVKSSATEGSEECNCSHSKSNEVTKAGILKSKSSTNSLVSKYIKSGMNQVASFIVESAIRFGEQHGVVIPDKNTPNLYQFNPPDCLEKNKKIWFKFPETKKIGWRNVTEKDTNTSVKTPTPKCQGKNDSSSWASTADSLEEILPILERLKQEGDVVTSELDLEQLRTLKMEIDGDGQKRDRDWVNSIEKERKAERDENERKEKRNKSRERDRYRDKEELLEKIRSLRKRYKTLAAATQNKNYRDCKDRRSRWKYRRDSVDLGRKRLRIGLRKEEPEH